MEGKVVKMLSERISMTQFHFSLSSPIYHKRGRKSQNKTIYQTKLNTPAHQNAQSRDQHRALQSCFLSALDSPFSPPPSILFPLFIKYPFVALKCNVGVG